MFDNKEDLENTQDAQDNEQFFEAPETAPKYTPEDEMAALKARARLLKITVRGNPSLETMRKLVNDAITGVSEDEKSGDESATESRAPLSKQDKEKQIHDDALRLVRVKIACMNPAKRDVQGEIISVGNKIVGTVKKFIPFIAANHPDGYHIPNILYQHLKQRKYQGFRTITHSNGQKTQKAELFNEFAIEVLPNLTPEQMQELARIQAAKKGV
ncbi:MAG: hypothetical protein [Podoviridae sp. ctLUJ1]|nr:MAG: hypothetical protein [Podoviridae sp. ctLUJ1]